MIEVTEIDRKDKVRNHQNVRSIYYEDFFNVRDLDNEEGL